MDILPFTCANELKFTVAAAFTFNPDIVIPFVKFNVAACVTVISPVVQAAKFDQVPVPAKNTGPKFLPPELIVFVPVPMKYTFIPVAQVPCAAVIVKLPYIFKLFAVELEANIGVLLVFDQVMLRQSAFGTFIVTV
jgi:hypothetical protein